MTEHPTTSVRITVAASGHVTVIGSARLEARQMLTADQPEQKKEHPRGDE